MNGVRKIAILCIVFFLLITVAQASDLSGTWTGASNTGELYTFIFSATEWSMNNAAGDDWQEGTYTFNQQSDPKTIFADNPPPAPGPEHRSTR